MLTTVKFFAFLAEKTHKTEVKLNLQRVPDSWRGPRSY